MGVTRSCAPFSLLSCYVTLRISLGCFRFQRRCVFSASAFLRTCPTLPLLLLPLLPTFTVLHLLRLNPCSLSILLLPPLPRHIAGLAFLRQPREEKKDNQETRMLLRLRR